MSDSIDSKELDETALEIIVSYKPGNSSNNNVNHEMSQLRSVFFDLLKKMPDSYKNVLEDRFVNKLSERQIAEKTKLEVDEIEEIVAEGILTFKKNINSKSIPHIEHVQRKEVIHNEPVALDKPKVVQTKSIEDSVHVQEQSVGEEVSPKFILPVIVGIFISIVLCVFIFSTFSESLSSNIFNFLKMPVNSRLHESNVSQINIEDSKNIKIVGSSSLSVLSNTWQKLFIKKYPMYKIHVVSNESDIGIEGLIEGRVDIANSSRPLLFSDTDKASKSGVELNEYRVAIDALVIAVNKDNPIESVTVEQLEKIFSGKVSNWNELTSFNESVLPIVREQGSGTNSFVRNRILGGNNFSYSIQRIYNDRDIMKLVAEKKGAISFINSTKYPWDIENVKYLNIKNYVGDEPIPPYINKKLNESAIRYGDYPLAHYLYLATRVGSEQKVQDYIDWVLSPEGQEEVKKIGLISVK